MLRPLNLVFHCLLKSIFFYIYRALFWAFHVWLYCEKLVNKIYFFYQRNTQVLDGWNLYFLSWYNFCDIIILFYTNKFFKKIMDWDFCFHEINKKIIIYTSHHRQRKWIPHLEKIWKPKKLKIRKLEYQNFNHLW
jgi:hypothetical protein